MPRSFFVDAIEVECVIIPKQEERDVGEQINPNGRPGVDCGEDLRVRAAFFVQRLVGLGLAHCIYLIASSIG